MQAASRPAPAVSGGRRGVLGGAVLVAIGAAFMLPPIGIPNAGPYLFVALGLAFAVAWWWGTRPYVYLVPAAVLIAFGLGLLIPTSFNFAPALAAPIFLGAQAIGLLAVFLIAPNRKLPLAPAGVLAVVALADLFAKIDLVPREAQPYFYPVILIVVGLYLLIEPRAH